jgi:tripartite-type tricarboxylate transporter receptor subunit TctC
VQFYKHLRKSTRRFGLSLIGAVSLASTMGFGLLASSIAMAQAYPNKPIRLVVPYAPGGAVDSLARPVAQKLSEILGQPVIVDNRPGANATLGADNVARSSPDGYSIVLTSIVHYLVPFFSKNVPYDTMKDLSFIMNFYI